MSLIKESIPNLLVNSIPRDLILGVEDALIAGAQRGYAAARTVDRGHRSHAIGQMRHFNMNEAFHNALTSAGANPSPIIGNGVITGVSGIFTIGRFNISEGVWTGARKSQLRKQLALANKSIEPLVQHHLFDEYVPAGCATVFFVACFAGKRELSEMPVAIQVAVPDSHMTGWLFRESLPKFLERYEQNISASQADNAIPRLKAGVGQVAKESGSDK